MKKIGLYLLACLFATTALFSCSEEYDEDDAPTIGTEYDGVYLGTLTYQLPNESKVELAQKIVIHKSNDAQVNLRMDNIIWKDNQRFHLSLVDVMATLEDLDSSVTLATNQSVELTELDLQAEVQTKGVIEGESLQLAGSVRFIGAELEEEVQVSFQGARLEQDLSSSADITSFEFSNAETMEGGVRILPSLREVHIAVSKDLTETDLKHLIPEIKVSYGASIEPQSGVAQDFTKPVVYTLTSEDQIVKQTYVVKLLERPEPIDFSSWVVGNPEQKPAEQYQVPKSSKNYQWASIDASFASFMGLAEEPESEFLPAKPSDKWSLVSDGAAAKLETLQLRANPYFHIPSIRSAMLYTGTFLSSVSANPHEYVRLGFPIHYAPMRIEGKYKFSPGSINYECIDYKNDIIEVLPTEAVDEFMIRAVLFELSEEWQEEDLLSLEEFYDTSTPKVVAVGEFSSSEAQLTFSPFGFDLVFKDGQAFNYRKTYGLAILCTSSRAGYRFSGAPGNTLWVEHLQVITE